MTYGLSLELHPSPKPAQLPKTLESWVRVKSSPRGCAQRFLWPLSSEMLQLSNKFQELENGDDTLSSKTSAWLSSTFCPACHVVGSPTCSHHGKLLVFQLDSCCRASRLICGCLHWPPAVCLHLDMAPTSCSCSRIFFHQAHVGTQ